MDSSEARQVPLCPVAKEALKEIEGHPLLEPLKTRERMAVALIAQEIVSKMLARAMIAVAEEAELKKPLNVIAAERPAEPKSTRVTQDGSACKDCGSFNMVRTGTCLTCQDCGSTSGGCA